MSKKEENLGKPGEEFNLLNIDPNKTNPFMDNLEIEFQDEVVETAIIKEVPITDEHTEGTENIEGDEKKEKNPEKKVDNKTPEKKEAKPEEPTDTTELETETTTEVEEHGEVTEESNLHTFASWAADEGILEPLAEDEKINSEDDLKKIVARTINKGIEEYKNSHPEEVQTFIDFVDNGGNPRDFHKLYYEQQSWKDIDPSVEANQELIVREALKQTGWDEEDIDSEITDKKDLGKLESLAEKFHKKLVAGEEAERKEMIEAQKHYQEKQRIEAKKQWDEFKDNLFKKEEVQGFKLTNKVKEDLWNFMTKPDRKTGKTPLQTHNETNVDAQVLYAYLAMNNWDITKLEKQVKTKVTSELSKKLKNITDSRNKISGGGTDGFKKESSKANFSLFKSAIDNNQI